MFSRFSVFLTAGLLCSIPAVASALPHAVFTVHNGSARDALADGRVPQAVVTVIMSDSNTLCEDWLALDFKPNTKYMLTRLSASSTGNGLEGCYEVPGRPSGADGCYARRGAFDGIQFVGASKRENAGKIKSSKFITGGYIKIDDLLLSEDGTGHLSGVANARFGLDSEGGSIEAAWCHAALPSAMN